MAALQGPNPPTTSRREVRSGGAAEGRHLLPGKPERGLVKQGQLLPDCGFLSGPPSSPQEDRRTLSAGASQGPVLNMESEARLPAPGRGPTSSTRGGGGGGGERGPGDPKTSGAQGRQALQQGREGRGAQQTASSQSNPPLPPFRCPPSPAQMPENLRNRSCRQRRPSRLPAPFAPLILSVARNAEEGLPPRGQQSRRREGCERPGLAETVLPHRALAAELITPPRDPAHAHSLTNRFSVIGDDGCGSSAAGEG